MILAGQYSRGPKGSIPYLDPQGLHEYLTRYDTLTPFLTHRNANNSTSQEERAFCHYYQSHGVGKTVRTRISNTSSFLTHSWEDNRAPVLRLAGQRGIWPIWPKYYDDSHAVIYVVDAVDHERLSEDWEVFGMVSSPSFLNTKQGALKHKRGF